MRFAQASACVITVLLVAVLGCTRPEPPPERPATDNADLAQLFNADQRDRQSMSESQDWHAVAERDSVRRMRVGAIMQQGLARTANDFYRAAMVYQHGDDTAAYRRAYDWARRSTALDSTHRGAKWLTAAAWDRYLMRAGRRQCYGTQIVRNEKSGRWDLHPVDTTCATDAQRAALGVKSLDEQRKEAARMVLHAP